MFSFSEQRFANGDEFGEFGELRVQRF